GKSFKAKRYGSFEIPEQHDTFPDAHEISKLAAKTQGANVGVLPMASVKEVNHRFENSLYGHFVGKHLAFPIVENYVKNTWAKYGLTYVMMDSNDFSFFNFSTKEGLERVLENGLWLIRNVLIILNIWTPNVSLTKDDITSVPIWVKFHDVPIVAFTDNGLSMIATFLIKLTSEKCLKDSLVMAILILNGSGHTMHTIQVEYEWHPLRCEHCKIFGHTNEQCPKNVISKPATHLNKDNFVLVTRKGGKGKQVDNKGDCGFEELFLCVRNEGNIFEQFDPGMQTSSSRLNEVASHNEKPMDDLVNNTRKKAEAPSKKTPRKNGIWSGKRTFLKETRLRKWSMIMLIVKMVDGFLMVIGISCGDGIVKGGGESNQIRKGGVIGGGFGKGIGKGDGFGGGISIGGGGGIGMGGGYGKGIGNYGGFSEGIGKGAGFGDGIGKGVGISGGPGKGRELKGGISKGGGIGNDINKGGGIGHDIGKGSRLGDVTAGIGFGKGGGFGSGVGGGFRKGSGIGGGFGKGIDTGGGFGKGGGMRGEFDNGVGKGNVINKGGGIGNGLVVASVVDLANVAASGEDFAKMMAWAVTLAKMKVLEVDLVVVDTTTKNAIEPG
ncbi:zinc knuckle CX2CX4HX4C containing protein, partial [Tanacetum coccineum]